MFLEPGWGWTGALADSRRLSRVQLLLLGAVLGGVAEHSEAEHSGFLRPLQAG